MSAIQELETAIFYEMYELFGAIETQSQKIKNVNDRIDALREVLAHVRTTAFYVTKELQSTSFNLHERALPVGKSTPTQWIDRVGSVDIIIRNK